VSSLGDGQLPPVGAAQELDYSMEAGDDPSHHHHDYYAGD
jgi:hypothetical protein